MEIIEGSALILDIFERIKENLNTVEKKSNLVKLFTNGWSVPLLVTDYSITRALTILMRIKTQAAVLFYLDCGKDFRLSGPLKWGFNAMFDEHDVDAGNIPLKTSEVQLQRIINITKITVSFATIRD